ncbi:MAG: hypothetical protein QXW37_08480, partial [Candidatus Nitrosotenuis sp.]
MSWQSKNEQTAIANIIKELEETRNIAYLNTIGVNQHGFGLGVGGVGNPTGSFGATAGGSVYHQVKVSITDIADDGSVGTRDRIDIQGTFIVVSDPLAPTNINLKWIQKATNNGHRIYLTPEQGKTLTLKVGGNIDIGSDLVIADNQIVELIFTTNSDVFSSGGFVIVGISGAGGISFPILYPEDNLGNVGNMTVNVNLSGSTAHYHEMTLVGNIGLAFSNPPAADKGFTFYIMFIQDATGGRSITSTPSALKNGSQLDGLLDKTPNAKTLFKFFTGDGGVSYHAEKIDLTAASSSVLWSNVTIDVNKDMLGFGLKNLDYVAFDTAITRYINGIAGTGINYDVPTGETHRLLINGVLAYEFTNGSLNMLNKSLSNLNDILFAESGQTILSDSTGLKFNIATSQTYRLLINGVLAYEFT